LLARPCTGGSGRVAGGACSVDAFREHSALSTAVRTSRRDDAACRFENRWNPCAPIFLRTRCGCTHMPPFSRSNAFTRPAILHRFHTTKAMALADRTLPIVGLKPLVRAASNTWSLASPPGKVSINRSAKPKPNFSRSSPSPGEAEAFLGNREFAPTFTSGERICATLSVLRSAAARRRE